MKLARIKPYDARRGNTRRTHVIRGMTFKEEGGWYEVTDKIAAYLKTVRTHENDPNSPLVFDVADDKDHAAQIEETRLRAIAQEEARKTGRAVRRDPSDPNTPARTVPAAAKHPILDAPDDDEAPPARGPKASKPEPPAPPPEDFAPGADEGGEGEEGGDLTDDPDGPQVSRDGADLARPVGAITPPAKASGKGGSGAGKKGGK